MGRFFTIPVFTAFLSIFLGGAILQRISLGEIIYNPRDVTPQSFLTLKKPVLDGVTLGMPRLYQHLAHIWVLQVFGDPDLKSKNPDDLKNSVQRVLDLSPQDEAVYLVPCFSLMFEFSRPQDCREILSLGMTAVPKSWLIPTVLGYVESFRFKDFARGREYFRIASNIAGAPPYLASLAERETPFLNGESDIGSEELIQSIMDTGVLAPSRQDLEKDVRPSLEEGVDPNPEPTGVLP